VARKSTPTKRTLASSDAEQRHEEQERLLWAIVKSETEATEDPREEEWDRLWKEQRRLRVPSEITKVVILVLLYSKFPVIDGSLPEPHRRKLLSPLWDFMMMCSKSMFALLYGQFCTAVEAQRKFRADAAAKAESRSVSIDELTLELYTPRVEGEPSQEPFWRYRAGDYLALLLGARLDWTIKSARSFAAKLIQAARRTTGEEEKLPTIDRGIKRANAWRIRHHSTDAGPWRH